MKESSNTLGERFVRTRQGFDAYVVSVAESDPNIADENQRIVDMNLAGYSDPAEFGSFAEIETEYSKLRKQISPDEPDGELIAERIMADEAMLRVLQGKPMKFGAFVLATMGFNPERFDDTEIDRLKAGVDKAMQKLDYRYDEREENGAESYLKDNLITDPQEIEDEFMRGLEISRVAGSRYAKHPAADFPLECQLQPDKAWGGYLITNDDGEFEAGVNTDPSRRYRRENILLTDLHEDTGHFTHFNILKDDIQRGEINLAMGVTSVTSPETTQAELLASFAESLLVDAVEGDDAKAKATMELKYSRLYNALLYNAIIDINSGTPEPEVFDYMRSNALFETDKRLATVIQSCRDFPTYRAGFMAYHQVDKMLAPLLANPKSVKSMASIKRIYSMPLTMPMLKKVIAGYPS